LAGLSAFGAWRWLVTRPVEGGRPWPLRRALEFNERIARATFRPGALAPEFPRSLAGPLRVNGTYGLRDAGAGSPIREVDPASYRLLVSWPGGERSLRLADLAALPRVEQTVEFKCIEGWSQVAHWSGVRFSDLVGLLGLNDDATPYVSLESIGGAYFVGLDIASAHHPQTLLATELNGEPLSPGHGSPLRLVIPVKYGIKNIKQIGSIRFASDRPRDFWAERGYDWYAGL
jgi:DMSO/TMAO reductase YedYZ molybdopterin-dependent catalytic subunit